MVSSAYIITLHLCRADGRSFTNTLKRSGPRMDPCGTPADTSVHSVCVRARARQYVLLSAVACSLLFHVNAEYTVQYAFHTHRFY